MWRKFFISVNVFCSHGAPKKRQEFIRKHEIIHNLGDFESDKETIYVEFHHFLPIGGTWIYCAGKKTSVVTLDIQEIAMALQAHHFWQTLRDFFVALRISWDPLNKRYLLLVVQWFFGPSQKESAIGPSRKKRGLDSV